MTAALSPVSSVSEGQAPTEWGDLAVAASAAGSMKPAWTAFLKRKFYVPILRSPDDDPKNYLLHFQRDAEGGHPTLVIAEVRERLDLEQGDGTVALSGVELLLRLDGQGAIDVTLEHGVFRISKKRADWLRSGIETTKSRVVIRKLLQAAAPGGPFPVLRVNAATQTVQPAAATQRLRELVELVVDARYFVPVTLSVSAIGMLWALGAARQSEPVAAEAAPIAVQAAAPAPEARFERPQAPVATAAFHHFVPWDNSFSVTLPGTAEEVELSPDQVAQLDGLPANFYRLHVDGVAYDMSTIHFGARMPPNLTEEMDHRQQLVVGSDGRLMSAKPVMFGTWAGREVRVRLADGSERLARYVFTADKFHMLMVSTPAGMAATTQINSTLHSFQLAR